MFALCVTGLPLIFHNEIDRVLAPAAPLPAVAPGLRSPGLGAVLARALAGHPGDVPLYMSFDDDRPVANITTGPAPDAPATAMRFTSWDLRNGDPIPPHGAPALALLLRLHTDLLLGPVAEYWLGAMGLVFAVALVSGAVLYAPFMARLGFGEVRAERSAAVRRLDRHNLLGAVTLAWALVVGLTGTINTLVGPVTDVWRAGALAGLAGAGEPAARPAFASIDAALATARAAAPGMQVQFVAFPGVAYSTPRHLTVLFQGRTPATRRLLLPVFIDARTGRLAAVRPMPWYMVALLLAEPLHFGDYAGLPMKLIWAVLDVATIATLWTGLRLWLARARIAA